MGTLIDLKKKYNALLERNSKAENYLNTHHYVQCATPLKNKDGTYKTKDDGMVIQCILIPLACLMI